MGLIQCFEMKNSDLDIEYLSFVILLYLQLANDTQGYVLQWFFYGCESVLESETLLYICLWLTLYLYQEFRWDLQELSVNVPGVCSFRGDDGHGFWITFLALLWDVVSPTSLRAWPQLHSLYGVCLNKRESKLQRDKGQSIIECFWQLPNLKKKKNAYHI